MRSFFLLAVYVVCVECRTFLSYDVCSSQQHCPSEVSAFWSLENIGKRAQPTNPKCGLLSFRLCAFKRKLQERNINEHPLQIAVLGGSFAAGTFLKCNDVPNGVASGTLCGWPKRLENELNSRLKTKRNQIQVENIAHGGTTTFWAVNSFHRVPKDVDLVIVDYDVNDGALLNDFPNRTKNKISPEEGLELLSLKIASGTEVLLRWLSELPNQPALLWIDSFAYDGRIRTEETLTDETNSNQQQLPYRPRLSDASCYRLNKRGYSISDGRKALLAYYGISSVSLRSAVWPSVNCPLPSMYELTAYQCTDTCHHPTFQTHQLLATWIADMLLVKTTMSPNKLLRETGCCSEEEVRSNKELSAKLPTHFQTPFASMIQVSFIFSSFFY